MDEFNLKWVERYLKLATEIATWSKDPTSKIGAVVIGNSGQILSAGYNGFPRGIDDTDLRLNDRARKLSLVVHAEMNCIYNASLTGTSLKGSSIFISGLPSCSECAKGIIQAGIKKVYVYKSDVEVRPEWKYSWKLSTEMFKEAGVEFFEV